MSRNNPPVWIKPGRIGVGNEPSANNIHATIPSKYDKYPTIFSNLERKLPLWKKQLIQYKNTINKKRKD